MNGKLITILYFIPAETFPNTFVVENAIKYGITITIKITSPTKIPSETS